MPEIEINNNNNNVNLNFEEIHKKVKEFYNLSDKEYYIYDVKSEVDKLINLIIYFVQNCKNVNREKLNWLLFLADVEMIKKTAFSISGLDYIVSENKTPIPVFPKLLDRFCLKLPYPCGTEKSEEKDEHNQVRN